MPELTGPTWTITDEACLVTESTIAPVGIVEEDEEEAEETTGVCGWCSSTEDNDNLYELNGESICGDCSFSCERCGDTTHINNCHTVSDEAWCEDCSDHFTFYCDGCEYTHNINSTSILETQSGNRCGDCVENYYVECEYCETYYYCDDGCTTCIPISCAEYECGYFEDNGEENDDHDHHRSINASNMRTIPLRNFVTDPIHDYSYKPNPKFRGARDETLFFGMELEMEIRSPDKHFKDAATEASTILEPAGIAYLKHDSSISGGGWNGFELVTHPMSWGSWNNDNELLWDTLEMLRNKYTARSWDSETCGIHVHVSRRGFDSVEHTHKFISLIYTNVKEMTRFAGRVSPRFATFGDAYAPNAYGVPELDVARKLSSGGQRGSAINTNNAHTLEARFFRGNMRKEGILANIGLLHASIKFSAQPKLVNEDMTWNNFQEYIGEHAEEYTHLVDRAEKSKVFDLFSKVVPIDA